MKNDSSRFTFDARKHFSSVRMQQGRVQIDADGNEQSDIVKYCIETEAGDVIGLCGAPMHYPAFHIVGALSELNTEEKALPGNAALPAGFKLPDFLISAGRYYVDGILCENEGLTSYLKQPDLLDAPPITEAGLYLIYVDVWQRLLTALDDPSIREIALGGPDTATREKTVWQVKYWPAVPDGKKVDGNCLTKFEVFEKLIAPSDGKLSARTEPTQANTDPCIVPSGAGYTGLENQLYRVEIHDSGSALDATTVGLAATRVPTKNDQIRVGGTWQVGQPIEIFSSKAGEDPLNGKLAYVTKVAVNKKVQTLTLSADVSKNDSQKALDELRVRPAKATFKWSRDNGVVVTTIQNIDGQKVTVHDLGPDDALGFKVGQWVEISDDGLELKGLPGQLAQITDVDSAVKLITLNVAPTLSLDQARHPKLRRWDGVGAVKFVSGDHFLDLENGVQVRFFAGSFRTGDYWTTAARTATADTRSGNIDWPRDAASEPVPQLPFGIKHHYCRLAMLHWDGKNFDVVSDCRNLFPPLTELTNLFYVGGDGQEAMPDLTQPAMPLVPRPLEKQLVVGVFNGQWPVKNARVRFSIVGGSGKISALPQVGDTINIITDENGLAACDWQLDSKTQTQQVEATLRAVADPNASPHDPKDLPVGLPVKFTANLSVASEVAYDPGACGTLKNQGTVQLALDRLSQLSSLYKISGDGQEIMPGGTVAPLKVLVASPCGLTEKAEVTFAIVTGKGTVGNGVPSVVTRRGADGFWSCTWKPDPETPFQEVEASIKGDATTPPVTVRFSLNLSTADHVSYDPGDCNALKGGNTVQKAIDQLSRLASLYEVSGNNQEIMPGETVAPLRVLVASPCGVSDKAEVLFEIVKPGKGTVGNSHAVVIRRGEDGFWTCNWKPDPETPFQEVEASIMGDATTPPVTVRFSLNLSKADHVSYNPDPKDCPDLALAKVTTVQAALNELCKRGKPQEEPGIHITEIKIGAATALTGKGNQQPLLNDTLVPVARLGEGLTIVCDKSIATSIMGFGNPPTSFPQAVAAKPTCFVTLDMPSGGGVYFQPMILACNVEVRDTEIHWVPTKIARAWLVDILFGQNLGLNKITDRVLAHLTLKGKFIVSSGPEPEMWLDGEAFGFRNSKQVDLVDLHLPSGDGRRGGDFEMWFWLFPGLILQATAVPSGITGTVLDAAGAVKPGVTVTATQSAVARTATTDNNGKFQLLKLGKGLFQVNAKLGDLFADREVSV